MSSYTLLYHSGKTSVKVVIKSGDTYSKLQAVADAKCGRGIITMDDWSPRIINGADMKPGIYTCDCPK
jgi:hypothetical protein